MSPDIDPREIAAWTAANLRARREYDKAPRRGYNAIDPVQVIALRDYLGLTWAEIAERLGCSINGARDTWTRATEDRSGYQVNKSTRVDVDEAKRLRGLGWPWREIAQRLGVHPRSIHQAIRRGK